MNFLNSKNLFIENDLISPTLIVRKSDINDFIGKNVIYPLQIFFKKNVSIKKNIIDNKNWDLKKFEITNIIETKILIEKKVKITGYYSISPEITEIILSFVLFSFFRERMEK